MERAFYSAPITEFLSTPTGEIEASLTLAGVSAGFAPNDDQRLAWRREISVMESVLNGRVGKIYFEFSIPRMGRRADVVVLLGGSVVVVEFKVGATEFTRAAKDQVWDYALDLKNFHESSHERPVVPILLATHAPSAPVNSAVSFSRDLTTAPILATPSTLASILDVIERDNNGDPIDPRNWEEGRYSPTPTIIEAALALYNHHSVADISRSDAGATNLTRTAFTLERLIQAAKLGNQKTICFVTGVPGAGKTLVGLNVATTHMDPATDLYSVYLSSNGPLVSVISEALAQDQAFRGRETGKVRTLTECRSQVKAFIQNVHHFRDEYWHDKSPPIEHVAIFDEAQRAWTTRQTSRFMARRKNVTDFAMSEPEFLISCMDRHSDWSVVICLVGTGQEINTGEAGLQEWFASLNRSFPEWRVFAPARIPESSPESVPELGALKARGVFTEERDLHLATSIRSYRAEKVSDLVHYILESESTLARQVLPELSRYPIALTRKLDSARQWLRDRARGSERIGVMVSSQALRLKPHAIDVRANVDPVKWFLGDADDTRASNFLEDAATEFQVQGLELDWSGVVWDADLRYGPRGWEHWSFTGSQWSRIQTQERQRYLTNAYRVLLTRARQGMILVVPEGDRGDPTRSPEFYDPIYQYLKDLGIQTL